MSQTFIFPVSAADQPIYSHERRGSKGQLQQRQSRLVPPFPLPRIPSGDAVPPEQTLHYHDHDQEHVKGSYEHDHYAQRLSRSPSHDTGTPLPASKRYFEASKVPITIAMAQQHRHVSKPTDVLLHATENYSLLHGILADKESRRIFYFMWLNLAFMAVQSTYGYLTGSLGLISDSVHMFFDCVALLVGVCAAVMSKWPPSAKFPYGYGKIDTLAGLGNGIFLMLISVEIVYEAVERLFEGSTLQRTSELLVVSIAGLCVNMVGIFAFHGHHGHHHGHDHGHDHSHSHNDHNDHRPSNAASASPTKPQAAGGHGHHHHGGENMQGIYLHIMADALGSVAVVVSTLLVQFTGWSGFDPLASCIIAVLIFISTVPLVSSTIKILLLSLNSDIEYNLRDVLGGISSIRGVVGYTAPKFWLEDIKKDSHDHHDHAHAHSHSHAHDHDHDHDRHNHDVAAHSKNHDHSHGHSHDQSGISQKTTCSHDHGNSDDHSHHHGHDHTNEAPNNDPTILGTIHIQVASYADLRDVQSRVAKYFSARKMDVVVQYEREGESKCWCSASSTVLALPQSGIGVAKTPQTGGMRTPMSGGGSFSAGFPSGFMANTPPLGGSGSIAYEKGGGYGGYGGYGYSSGPALAKGSPLRGKML